MEGAVTSLGSAPQKGLARWARPGHCPGGQKKRFLANIGPLGTHNPFSHHTSPPPSLPPSLTLWLVGNPTLPACFSITSPAPRVSVLVCLLLFWLLLDPTPSLPSSLAPHIPTSLPFLVRNQPSICVPLLSCVLLLLVDVVLVCEPSFVGFWGSFL